MLTGQLRLNLDARTADGPRSAGVSLFQSARFEADDGPLDCPMAASDATGRRLVKDGDFGADLIRFPPGGRVADHRHPGGHILVVLDGSGWVDYDGIPHRLEPGVCYLVPAGVRHGIRADAGLTLISVANGHRDVAAEDRLECC